MMKFLWTTKKDVLTLSAKKGLHSVEWCIDAAFAVHPDFKSHTGATQHFVGGKGVVQSISAKQKLNTLSSTTSESVGADQVSPVALWTPLFVEAQGHCIEETKVWQDNQNTMLLEKRGKTSSGKRTRALNMRHFVTTNQVGRGNCTIKCCPTDDVVGDHMTKGLQGVKFATFHKKIVGMQEHFKMQQLIAFSCRDHF